MTEKRNKEITNPPYCDGNSNYWNGTKQTTQLADALFEIACWDGSATILIGLTNELARNFVSVYTDSKELEKE